ncbi:hypothetical protein PFISCL1PPCAC_1466, partial [Pristionchus fissidentatus]
QDALQILAFFAFTSVSADNIIPIDDIADGSGIADTRNIHNQNLQEGSGIVDEDGSGEGSGIDETSTNEAILDPNNESPTLTPDALLNVSSKPDTATNSTPETVLSPKSENDTGSNLNSTESEKGTAIQGNGVGRLGISTLSLGITSVILAV